MRDPSDTFDLPHHLTWQMNLVIDHANMSHDAQGVNGETFIPLRYASGDVMNGMESIRGQQERCKSLQAYDARVYSRPIRLLIADEISARGSSSKTCTSVRMSNITIVSSWFRVHPCFDRKPVCDRKRCANLHYYLTAWHDKEMCRCPSRLTR